MLHAQVKMTHTLVTHTLITIVLTGYKIINLLALNAQIQKIVTMKFLLIIKNMILFVMDLLELLVHSKNQNKSVTNILSINVLIGYFWMIL